MTTPRAFSWFAGLFLSLGLCGAAAGGADEADLILHGGKVVTVDRDFSIRQALAVQGDRFYTINNARLLFLEDRIGSLEEGKQADFVVTDRDLLTCPEDEIREAPRPTTYLDGTKIFERQD